MTTQLDLLFTSILHGYLDTAESRAAGVPAAAACALLKMDQDTDERDPRICLSVTEDGTGREKTLSVIAVSRGTAPRSTTGPWLQKVGERLADEPALMAYIATLPADQRTGWQLEAISPPLPGKIDRQDGGIIESGIGVRIIVTI